MISWRRHIGILSAVNDAIFAANAIHRVQRVRLQRNVVVHVIMHVRGVRVGGVRHIVPLELTTGVTQDVEVCTDFHLGESWEMRESSGGWMTWRNSRTLLLPHDMFDRSRRRLRCINKLRHATHCHAKAKSVNGQGRKGKGPTHPQYDSPNFVFHARVSVVFH